MPATLLSISQMLAIAGVLVAISALLLVPFIKKSGKRFFSSNNIRELGRLEQSVFLLVSCAGILLGLALVISMVAGLWWCLTSLLEAITPIGLAVISILFGVAPFLLTVLAVVLARLLSGSVNASGANNCHLLGFNLNTFVHSLFMSYWCVLFTGGIAIFGLIGSGIWALLR